MALFRGIWAQPTAQTQTDADMFFNDDDSGLLAEMEQIHQIMQGSMLNLVYATLLNEATLFQMRGSREALVSKKIKQIVSREKYSSKKGTSSFWASTTTK